MRVENPIRNPSRWSEKSVRYTPIDEILAMPRTRVLRTLTHFDIASGEDINLALDNLNERDANAHTKCLERLVGEGLVERIMPPYRAHRRRVHPSLIRYRITDDGRKQLRELLARGEVTEGLVAE